MCFCEAASSHLHWEVREMDWMVFEGPFFSVNSLILGDCMELKSTSAYMSEDIILHLNLPGNFQIPHM